MLKVMQKQEKEKRTRPVRKVFHMKKSLPLEMMVSAVPGR
jgi:hypothetical protein